MLWPFEDANAAIDDLARLGRVILGVDVREPDDAGLVTEVSISDYQPKNDASDVEGRRPDRRVESAHPVVCSLAKSSGRKSAWHVSLVTRRRAAAVGKVAADSMGTQWEAGNEVGVGRTSPIDTGGEVGELRTTKINGAA